MYAADRKRAARGVLHAAEGVLHIAPVVSLNAPLAPVVSEHHATPGDLPAPKHHGRFHDVQRVACRRAIDNLQVG